MPTDAHDTEITLAYHDLRLKVSPYGAALRGLWRESADGGRAEIITGYTGAAGKVGGQGDVLIPFPGRVRDGRYTFEGRTYQMPISDKEGPNAIHGFLRAVIWETVEHSEHSTRFRTTLRPDDHEGYPFSLEVAVTYALDAHGMRCHFAIRNTGDGNAPVAAGFHPYFTVGSEWIDTDLLYVPLAATLEMRDLLPTGHLLPVDGTSLDFRDDRPIAETAFNTCYLAGARDLDGKLRIRLATHDESRAVTVWIDSAFNYVVLYSGDPLPDSHRRRALAIEPMTCASDGFNHREWGMVKLAPGHTFSGAWGVVEEKIHVK